MCAVRVLYMYSVCGRVPDAVHPGVRRAVRPRLPGRLSGALTVQVPLRSFPLRSPLPGNAPSPVLYTYTTVHLCDYTTAQLHAVVQVHVRIL